MKPQATKLQPDFFALLFAFAPLRQKLSKFLLLYQFFFKLCCTIGSMRLFRDK